MRSVQFSKLATRVVLKRGMATEKQLKLRINGIKNIADFTKSMKMVSAAKLRGDQQRLAAADTFSSWASLITGKEKALEKTLPVSDFPQKNLSVATKKPLLKLRITRTKQFTSFKKSMPTNKSWCKSPYTTSDKSVDHERSHTGAQCDRFSIVH